MHDRSTTAGGPSKRVGLRRVAVGVAWWAIAMVLAQMLVAPLLWLASVVAGASLPIGVWSMTVGAFTKPAAGIGQWIAVTALVVAVRSIAPANGQNGRDRHASGDGRAVDVPVLGEGGDR